MFPHTTPSAAAIALLCGLLSATGVRGGEAGGCGGGPPREAVVHSRDGFAFVREEPRVASRGVATVRTGNRFRFDPQSGPGWFRVTLESGAAGWLHHSTIRLSFAAGDLFRDAGGDSGDRDLVLRAAAGDTEALGRLLEFESGSPPAPGTLNALLHLAGDAAFARSLRDKPLSCHLALRRSLIADIRQGGLAPFDGPDYLRRRFPQVWSVLFRRVVTDWPSPDGKFAIRKVFPEAFPSPDSVVERAEVVDPRSGRVLFDFTDSDTGRGESREGSIVWSSDSRTFTSIAREFSPTGTAGVRTRAFRLIDGSFRRIESRNVPCDPEPGPPQFSVAAE